MEGYLGQGHRSSVKVTRSKNVHWDVPLTSESIVTIDLPKMKLRNMTWGFSKRMHFLYHIIEAIMTPLTIGLTILFSFLFYSTLFQNSDNIKSRTTESAQLSAHAN